MLGKQLKLFTISPLVGSGLILWMPQGRDRPRPARNLHQGRTGQARLSAGLHSAHRPAGTVSHLRAISRITATPSFRRCTCGPRPGVLDLCQYRLAKGELDDDQGSRDRTSICELAALRLPGYEEADRRGEAGDRPSRVPWSCSSVLRRRACRNIDKADHRGASGRRLLNWLKEQEGFLLKPMNCPHHIQIYKAEPRSYRDLPVRLAEFGTVYRFEQTGELNGMTRVRGFTQDDAHLFITPEQVEAEMRANIDLVLFVLSQPRPERLPGPHRLARSGQRQVRRRRRGLGRRRSRP